MSTATDLASDGTGDGSARSSWAKLRGLTGDDGPLALDGSRAINIGSARGGPREASDMGACKFTAEWECKAVRTGLGSLAGCTSATRVGVANRWLNDCGGSSLMYSMKRGRGNSNASHHVSGESHRDLPREDLLAETPRERLCRFGAEMVLNSDVREAGLRCAGTSVLFKVSSAGGRGYRYERSTPLPLSEECGAEDRTIGARRGASAREEVNVCA